MTESPAWGKTQKYNNISMFDFQSRTCYKVKLFSFKEFLIKSKEADTTSDFNV